MDVILVKKPAFSVIGKEGQGLSKEAKEWILPLWHQANQNFAQIEHLAKADEKGNPGIWGVMSDIEGIFAPWGEQGKYMAACEVEDEAPAPAGWCKWRIPAYTYAVVSCSQATYGEVFSQMIKQYLPSNDLQLAGAVHEYYPQDDLQQIQLFFPVEKQVKKVEASF